MAPTIPPTAGDGLGAGPTYASDGTQKNVSIGQLTQNYHTHHSGPSSSDQNNTKMSQLAATSSETPSGLMMPALSATRTGPLPARAPTPLIPSTDNAGREGPEVMDEKAGKRIRTTAEENEDDEDSEDDSPRKKPRGRPKEGSQNEKHVEVGDLHATPRHC